MHDPAPTTDSADATRHEILRHASDLFEHYGFNKTTIGDIAERCQMSPGNLYRFYRNKQAIGLASVDAYFKTELAAMEAVLMIPEGGAEDRIRRFLEAGVRHIVDKLDRAPKIVELAEFLCDHDEGWELLGRHLARRRERLAREIARGIETGELAPCDPERTAATLQNGIKMFFMPMTLIRWRDRATILPELRDILDLMFRGLRAR